MGNERSGSLVRRVFPRLLFVLGVLPWVAPTIATGMEMPINGIDVPKLAGLDQAMVNAMETHNISAGTLAVMRHGVPIYHKTFGWQNAQKTNPLPLNTMMRLASVTKPVTAAAIRSLINQGDLNLSDRVFSADEHGTGILDHIPFGTPDSRIGDITVEHLLKHRAGWDRGEVGDWTYRERDIANAMGIPSPPGRDATMRYILGQPLQFSPGTKSAYSNIGYMTLGLITEAISGMPHLEVMRQNVFGPIGVDADMVAHGRTQIENQDPREPYYDSNGAISTNLYWPNFSSDIFVERAYGGFDVDARIGQGGLVASPMAILEFIDNYQLGGSNIGGPRNPSSWYTFNGAYTGTNTTAVQRGDGINYVILFNKRSDGLGMASSSVRDIINSTFDWPTLDISLFSELNGIVGDLNQDGSLDGLDIDRFVAGWRTDTSSMGGIDRYYHGDLDLNGITDLRDAFTLHQVLQGEGLAGLDFSTLGTVPEPSSILLLSCAWYGIAVRRRRLPTRYQ